MRVRLERIHVFLSRHKVRRRSGRVFGEDVVVLDFIDDGVGVERREFAFR